MNSSRDSFIMRRRYRSSTMPRHLVWLGTVLFSVTQAHAADDDIRLATIGYLPDRPKVASVLGSTGTSFAVKLARDGAVKLDGTLSSSVSDPDTADQLRFADFSKLSEAGTYYLEVDGVGRSSDFRIGDDVYAEQLVSAMLGFYGWRSGMAVEFSHRNQTFKQGPGHLQDGLLDYLGQPGVVRDGSRGWYDAGDYGKYTVNGAFTLGMLLRAWEMFPSQLEAVALPIPERGGKLPDYLDEIKWEYDWLATMQYSATDGRVSHKLTSLEFADFIMPERDVAPVFYSPHGSAAAADFVAAMAIGARVYRTYDEGLADEMLAAARLSFQWLSDNPADLAPDLRDFKTGPYDTPDADDRLWAAVEMWETTGDQSILSSFESRVTQGRTIVATDFDWSSLKNMAVYTYLLSKRSGRDAGIVSTLQSKLLECAEILVHNHDASGYGRALTAYYWGSNGSVARTCLLLQVANRLAPDERYVNTCAAQIAHLYGRNAYNRSYVTGEGKNPPLHPHHRPSAADGIERPFPGLLVGGSNSDAKGWVDEEEDYESNEVAVNWNAPLVFALAGFVPPGWSPSQSPTAGGSGTVGSSTGGVAGSASPGSGGTSAGRPATSQTTGGASTESSAIGGASDKTARSATSGGASNATSSRGTSSVIGGATALATAAASNSAGGDGESGCNCRSAANPRHSVASLIPLLILLARLGRRRRYQ